MEAVIVIVCHTTIINFIVTNEHIRIFTIFAVGMSCVSCQILLDNEALCSFLLLVNVRSYTKSKNGV